MKRILLLIVLLLLVLMAARAGATGPGVTCPEGSYVIDRLEDGEPICKQQPTGCPYGDSVPLGAACDKLAPQKPAESPKTPQAASEPVYEPFAGK